MTARPYAAGIEVTGEEQTFKWKAPGVPSD